MWVILLSSVLLLPAFGKQSQLLLQPTEVEVGLQVGVEFDKIINLLKILYVGLAIDATNTRLNPIPQGVGNQDLIYLFKRSLSLTGG